MSDTKIASRGGEQELLFSLRMAAGTCPQESNMKCLYKYGQLMWLRQLKPETREAWPYMFQTGDMRL